MVCNGRNGFGQYESDVEKVWVWKLSTSYHKIEREQRKHSGQALNAPVFEINPNINCKWGSWNPGTRKMTISAKLLRNFEWGAVEHTMRHEIAHQIVSEIFDMDCYGVAHGEAWERACDMVGIEPDRCSGVQFLSGFKGTESSPMVDRVRKIIIHANDKAATEEEAEQFMRKAKELMFRHDIEMRDVTGKDRLWISRPFGSVFKRFPSYMYDLGRLLKEHYNVEYIRTYGPKKSDGIGYYSRLELFGEPDNLDIAEYVGHALLNQAEILYKQYKQKVSEERAEGLASYRRLSKRAYIEGLIDGFSEKLEKDRESAKKRVGEKIAKEEAQSEGREYTPGDCAIVPAYNKKLLREMYSEEYPDRTTTNYSASRGLGLSAGREAGSKLTLARGVQRGGNSGRLLNGVKG